LAVVKVDVVFETFELKDSPELTQVCKPRCIALVFLVKGKTNFINNGVKVNAKYGINQELKPFLKKDVPPLFPGRENDMLFHQDSAYRPAAKMTVNYLNEPKVNCITSTESMLKAHMQLF
jgi:hypothetical protein